MGRCPFVEGKVVRIDLPGGEWIDVKSELNAGEDRAMWASTRVDRGDGKVEFDPTLVWRAKQEAYLLGWSFTMRDGSPAPLTRAALDNLDGETVADIRDALEAHEAAVMRARRDRKNSRDGGTNSTPTSPSAASWGGPTATSSSSPPTSTSNW